MPRKNVPIADAKTRLLAEIGLLARRQAASKVQSETLRDALFVDIVPTEDKVTVGVPHYWAIYYHDGRGPIRAKPGKFLVYFKDPSQDPRIQNGYPERAASIVRLTREQFLEALARDQLIVVKSVGPAGPHPFFTRGMDGFQDKVHEPARRFMSSIMRDLGVVGPVETDSARIKLK